MFLPLKKQKKLEKRAQGTQCKQKEENDKKTRKKIMKLKGKQYIKINQTKTATRLANFEQD